MAFLDPRMTGGIVFQLHDCPQKWKTSLIQRAWWLDRLPLRASSGGCGRPFRLNRRTPFTRSRKRLALTAAEVATLRNRIWHHEPLIARDLSKDFANVMSLLEWICPSKAAWIRPHCRVPRYCGRSIEWADTQLDENRAEHGIQQLLRRSPVNERVWVRLRHGPEQLRQPCDVRSNSNRSCFIVRDNNGQALAYVYFETEPGRRTAANSADA